MNLESIISSLKGENKNKKIIFPNANDKRILEAVKILVKEGHNPVICGNNDDFSIYSNIDVEKIENNNGESNNIFAAQLLNQGAVDGMISGNLSSTADVVKALIKNVGSKKDIGRMSSYFLMQTSMGLKLFADCAIQADPSVEQLAEIALLTAISASQYGISPKIAMLSFSTNGSANHAMTQKVKKATLLASELLHTHNCDATIEGELQVDAAIIPEIALSKNPCSLLKGEANILIFPNLDAGNIGYKLVERFGNAKAIGPIIQGLKKPGNDLSRGCSVEDILNLYYITANS